MDVDAALGGRERPFGRKPGTFSLGPTGGRLWATCLDPRPGFSGLFDFIHRTNIPLLFTLDITDENTTAFIESSPPLWSPSFTEQRHRALLPSGGHADLHEWKFITADDCAVCVMEITNRSGHAVSLAVRPAWADGPSWSYSRFGLKVFVEGAFGPAKEATLAPGQARRWTVACSLALSKSQAARAVEAWLARPDPLAAHRRTYQSWFDLCPSLECGDPLLETLWAYRWYLVRRNTAAPEAMRLRRPVVYEGRGSKMTLDAWDPKGWEFSKLIPFSTPMHLLEGRWHPDASACRGSVLALVENQTDEGLLPCVQVDRVGGSYINFLAWAVWQFHLVQPDRDWLAEVAPGLQRELDAVLRMYDPDGSGLPAISAHGRMGKEYQPSFFHDAGYPRDLSDVSASPVRRVDFACYTYLNAFALSCIWSELGDESSSARCRNIAERTRDAILRRMWNSGESLFYDISATTERQIPVKQVVGYDPFFAGIAGRQHAGAFRWLNDPETFGLPYPVPSCEKNCPAFSAESGWMGRQIKGPHGCLWNGPTWPFTNSTVLMGLANASRACGHALDADYARLFRKNFEMAFRDGQPILYEHYNPITGHPISQEEDYFHSTWIDLVLSHIAGIISGGECATFDPIGIGLQGVRVSGVPFRGRLITTEALPEPGARKHP